MRNVLVAVLVASVICLVSCSKTDDASTSVITIPSADSVSKNSDIKILISPTDSVELHDLTVQGLPAETVSAFNTFNPSDSTYTTNIIVGDSKKKVISMNLIAKNTSMDPLATVYTVTSNNSTFTDYRTGENKTYAVTVGSTLTLTSAIYPLQGTFNLQLNYNTTSSYITGTFNIYK